MNNKKLKIKDNTTANSLPDLFDELEKSHNVGLLDLELPKGEIELGFSLMFSLVQLVATWLRKSYSGNLILPVKSIEEAVKLLEDKEYVYPSVVLCWNKEIHTLNGENIRVPLKEASRNYFKKMEFFELKGASVPIYCFDHDKVNRGKSRHLYDQNLELVDEDSLGWNLHKAYEKVSIHNQSVVRKNLRKTIDDFNAIIHEGFANTDEHAVTNVNGHYLYPNIRSLLLKFHKKTIQGFKKTYSEYKGLDEYFDSDFSTNSQREVYLIEISVLDSGPGLYRRYTGREDLPEKIFDEVGIIKECLYRHNTSEIGTRKTAKGIGLDRILQVIDNKGFVRIRTGRTDVFRNMKKHRYEHHMSAQEIQLFDTAENSNSAFKTNPFAEGTLISIFYPLEL